MPDPARVSGTVRVYSPDDVAEDLPPAEAEARLREGYTVDPDETPALPIRRTDTNEVEMVPTEQAMQRLQFAGTALSSQRELAYQRERESYDTVGNKALALGTGVVNSALLGFGDAATVKVGQAFGVGNEVARELANQRNYLGGYRTAGELAGFALPALATGGGYGALRGITAGGRGLAAAGGALEGAVARGLVRAGAAEGGLLARTAGAAASGGLELGVYGAGDATSRAVVENPGLTAEQAIAAMGGGFLHGAAAGAAFGGVMGFGGGLLRAGAVRAGEAATALGQRAKDAASSAWGRLGGAGERAAVEGAEMAAPMSIADKAAEATIRIATEGGTKAEADAFREMWKNRTVRLHEGEKTIEATTRDLRANIDELLSAERRLTEEAQGKLKIEQVKKAVRTDAQEAQLSYVNQQLEGIKANVREMLADSGAFGQRAQLKETESILAKVERDIAKQAGEDGFAAAAFTELDYLKRRLGKFSKPGQFLGADQATAQRFRDIYEGLRVGLEDTALWGKAAEQQTAINRAWMKQLETKKLFQGRFATEVGRDEIDPWLSRYASDPAKLASYLNGFGKAANDLNHEALVAHVANTRALAEAIGKSYELPAAKAAEVARAAKAADKFGNTIKTIEKDVAETNAVRRAREAESQGAFGMGPLGVAVDVASKPVQTLTRIAEMEAMAAKVQKRMDAAIGAYFGTAKKSAEGAASSLAESAGSAFKSATEKAGKAAKRVGEFAGQAVKAAEVQVVERTAREDKQPVQKRFAAKSADVVAARTNLPQRQQQLAQQMAGAPPEFVAQALATQQRAAEYLASKIPPAPQAMATLQPHLDKSQPPPAEMARFLRQVAAVEDPTTVLRSLERGDITPEQVDALRVVYPEMYAQVQQRIMGAVAEQGDKRLPYNKVLALSQLFDTPLDPSLRPEFVAAQQAALQAPPESVTPPARKPMKPSNLAKNYDLNTEEP